MVSSMITSTTHRDEAVTSRGSRTHQDVARNVHPADHFAKRREHDHGSAARVGRPNLGAQRRAILPSTCQMHAAIALATLGERFADGVTEQPDIKRFLKESERT